MRFSPFYPKGICLLNSISFAFLNLYLQKVCFNQIFHRVNFNKIHIFGSWATVSSCPFIPVASKAVAAKESTAGGGLPWRKSGNINRMVTVKGATEMSLKEHTEDWGRAREIEIERKECILIWTRAETAAGSITESSIDIKRMCEAHWGTKGNPRKSKRLSE